MMFDQSPKSRRIFKQLAKALIRLRICAGWSEPLLVAHITLLETSCCSSNNVGYQDWNSQNACREYPDFALFRTSGAV